MKSYFASKIAEYGVLVTWADERLRELAGAGSPHLDLIAQITERLREVQSKATVVLPFLMRQDDADRSFEVLIVDLDYWCTILKNYFIPSLLDEKAEDIRLGRIVLITTHSIGLGWVKDVLIRMSGHHATFAVFSETPLIFSPPHHDSSFVEMPALFHELGHDVYSHNREVVCEGLSNAARDYLSAAHAAATDQQSKEDLAAALDYWDSPSRLMELFCDVFATFCCGPAHLFTCLDCVVRLCRDPYGIAFGDPHPPGVARVLASFLALPEDLQVEPLVKERMVFFQTFLRRFSHDARIDLICSQPLLRHLVDWAIEYLISLLPAGRYITKLPISPAECDATAADTLSTVLNKAATVLLRTPKEYQKWEQDNFKRWRDSFLEKHK